MTGDRRDAERVSILGSLPAEVMVYVPMAIKEIGHGGLTAETSFPLHLDSLHDLRLPLEACSVVVKGRVVHSRIIDVDQDVVTYRTGFEFVELPERVGTVITEYVNALKANRAG
jgi:hypothetical protein